VYFSLKYSGILGRKVVCKDKKIGSLQDIIVLETKTLPEISYFIVSRPFGYPSIYIPWQNVIDINEKNFRLATVIKINRRTVKVRFEDNRDKRDNFLNCNG
jgi:hypothetical protein